MPKEAPNFALLIGKKGAGPGDEGPPDHGKDLGIKDAMDKTAAEDSAVKSLMTGVLAKDPGQVKQALKDFIEACYPGVLDGDEPDGDEGSPDDGGGDMGSDGGDGGDGGGY